MRTYLAGLLTGLILAGGISWAQWEPDPLDRLLELEAITSYSTQNRALNRSLTTPGLAVPRPSTPGMPCW